MAARKQELRFEILDLRRDIRCSMSEAISWIAQISNLKSQISDLRPTTVRRGVTLLELILALSLSVILLFAVGMSLRLYWRSFDAKRTNVEQAHLARAILRKMEDDLRTAIQYTPVDLSGLESMANASSLAGALAGMTSAGTPGSTPSGGAGASSGGSGGSGSSGGGSTPMGNSASSSSPIPNSAGQGAAGAASTSGAASAGSASTGGAATSGQSASGTPTEEEPVEETPPPVIGLYGSAYQIQFDVSRLPRVDEYGSGSPTSMVQIPSDIKTVTYYVRGETTEGSGTISTFGSGGSGSTAPGSSEPSASGQGRGLMRLEMDRAVSAFGQTSGSASSDYDSAKLLASEVTSIAFRYWNGTEWASDWNSDEMGGLPLAVEIVMTMADANSEATPVQNSGTTGAISTEPTYRIVVSLPTASLPPPVEEPAETETATTTTTTGATGGTGSGATKSGGGATSSSGAAGSSGSSTSGSSSGGSSTYGTGSKTGGS